MKFSILFGGKSFEHEISIVSAIALKKLLANTDIFIFLDDNHEFYLIKKENMKSVFFSSKSYLKEPKIYPKKNGFFTRTLFGEKQIQIPTIINLIHGGDGEDGAIASLLDFYEIPYIGPRKEACILSYDKELTKMLANHRGVNVLDYQVVFQDSKIEVENFPVIIKPARLGSSLGISIVKNKEELEYSLDKAFEYDKKVIIESFIPNIKEYNLAGFFANKELHFSFVEEPKKDEFLDFNKKYLDFSRTTNTQQADITTEVENMLKDNFSKIYTNLFEGAVIRCDFFIHNNTCYLNEINPIPGSLANYLFADFPTTLNKISTSLPKPNNIKATYKFLNEIKVAKGK
ncbi:D-alanine--D-alanine ligase [Helicobacter ibis]|uniref:D-alanine--D-alanine ligase n=1 Tax=Helicobacter ibis TaxID=2962633 RepID=A0ABT4VEA9_9HELI|nr:D-alanine--D-alanine ligase [Helicobacter ibis]MDA3969034.1 D-alanine--D-alanine ligase [Helicobacter ibis]